MPRPLLSVAVVALWMLPAPAVRAHDICCAHKHTGGANNANTCKSSGHACADWNGGICVDKITHGYLYCSCKLNTAAAEYALLLVNALSSLDGPPAPDTTVSYQTSVGPDSFGELLYADATVVSFAPNAPGPGGFVSLTFGSFADPAAVPVTVDQWFFEFPPGTIGGSPVGPSSTALDPGETTQLLYDSTTNVLSTPPGESMLLTVTNDVHSGAPLRLLWTGVLDPTPGQEALQAQIQSVPTTPVVPALPGTGAYALLAALLLLVATRRPRRSTA